LKVDPRGRISNFFIEDLVGFEGIDKFEVLVSTSHIEGSHSRCNLFPHSR